MGQAARLFGIGTPETVRKWCRQGEVDAGARPGVTSEESAELKRVKRESGPPIVLLQAAACAGFAQSG